MKIAKFRIGRRVAHGVVQGEQITEVRGNILGNFRITTIQHPLKEVKLLPSTDPHQIWCPGMNFADHLAFAGSVYGQEKMPTPQHPDPWHKGRNSIIGHEEHIIIPKDSTGEVHYEGEAVAVIKKLCRRVSPQDALKYVLGYTCGNDVSERTWQREDWTMWRAKGTDTFAPIGPWIETNVDPNNLEMIVRLNDQEVQRANTRDMIHSFATIISYISQQVTLYPGDLVFSGTTGNTSTMKSRDVVEVEIGDVGVLRNYVKAEE